MNAADNVATSVWIYRETDRQTVTENVQHFHLYSLQPKYHFQSILLTCSFTAGSGSGSGGKGKPVGSILWILRLLRLGNTSFFFSTLSRKWHNVHCGQTFKFHFHQNLFFLRPPLSYVSEIRQRQLLVLSVVTDKRLHIGNSSFFCSSLSWEWHNVCYRQTDMFQQH